MQTSDLQGRLLERLGDTASGEYALIGYYSPTEVLAWLNAAQRLFVLLTLCLETTATLTLNPTPPNAFYSMMPLYSDWLLPLRVRNSNGWKVKPARVSDLAALDANWSIVPGFPTRYALLGFDLLCVYQQPSWASSLSITYAQCPVPLVNPTDVPAIPEEYHPALIEGAIPLCRAKEGGAEWQKVMPSWDRFIDAATRLGDYMRARNKEQGYDRMPAELKLYDRSHMLEAASGK